MKRAGFVLVGGSSSRMGQDKALLRYGRATLVEHVAGRVEAAAGSVALVGPPGRYGALGYPVIPDEFPDCGPLAGIQAALSASRAEWNLVTACDMPALTVDFLVRLLEAAEASGAAGLVPRSPAGWLEPLCAVYHRDLASPLTAALQQGVRKVSRALAGLPVAHWPILEPAWPENLNTPQDCARLAHAPLLLSGAP